jgi:site-specific recombinase XerD
MSHVSLKIVLHSKKHKDGTQPVMLQCIISRPGGTMWKRRVLLRVAPKFFDADSGRIKRNHPFHLDLNEKIAEALHDAEKRLLDIERRKLPIDPTYILTGSGGDTPEQGMLLAHGRAYVEKCRQKGQIHTAEKYESHVRKLAAFLGNDLEKWEQADYKVRDILMDDITEKWVLNWSDWLKKNGAKSANTLHRRIAFLTTLFNDARKRRFTTADPLQFLEFKEVRVRKPKLTAEQIRMMEDIELDGREADARNTFLLQFYAYGTRISDALLWKKADVHKRADGLYLEYTSMKTGDLITVRLSGRGRVLVEQYQKSVDGPFLLPWLARFTELPNLSDNENKVRLIKQIESKTELVNKALKRVAKKAGIELNLSTHIARHSFANLADERVADKRKISAALGHSKFATTEIYLKELRQSDVNDAMDAVFMD